MIGSAAAYTLLFLSLYFEVFLLVSFIESVIRRKRENKMIRKFPAADLPSVAIAVPSYNEEQTLTATMLSLLALSYPHEKIEFIIVDDGSTDNTLAVARSFETDPRVKVFH